MKNEKKAVYYILNSKTSSSTPERHMKLLLVFISMLFSVTPYVCDAEPWTTPAQNSENAEETRSPAFPLLTERPAFEKNETWTTPYTFGLEGVWKIRRFSNETDFCKAGMITQITDFSNINVPNCEELQGYGTLHQTNATIHGNLKRGIPDSNFNPISVYKTHFNIPKLWKNRPVFIRFDGVYGAMELYINKKRIGYHEMSGVPVEFNITHAVIPKGNILTVVVRRYCDESFLASNEEVIQFSGIYRDVTLFAPPSTEISDFTFRSFFTDTTFDNAKLLMDANVRNICDTSFQGSLTAEILDDKGKSLFQLESRPFTLNTPSDSISISFPSTRISDPYKWSPEAPYLYTAIFTLRDSQNAIVDVRCCKHGFCQREIKNGTFLFNGKPIRIHGVRRSEFSEKTGTTLSREQMINEIILMKRNNINTVLTSNGPCHPDFYDLCDRYGLWVIAEAQLRNAPYATYDFSRDTAWQDVYIRRNLDPVKCYKNHPSILMWSLGQNAGDGVNIQTAATRVRNYDPTRPLHYAGIGMTYDFVDISGDYLPTCDWAQFQLANRKLAPYFMPAYASAGGNGLGGLHAYEQLLSAYPFALGGCVDNWMDQCISYNMARRDPKGNLEEKIYFFGDASDYNPKINGLIQPNLKETPKLAELKRVFQNISLKPIDLANGKFTVENKLYFKNLKYYAIRWALMEDGVTVERGMLDPINVRPQQTGELTIPFQKTCNKPGADYQLRISFLLQKSTRWAPRDFEVATAQFRIPPHRSTRAPAQMNLSGCRPLIIRNPSHDTLEVTHKDDQRFAVRFDRKTGIINALTINGIKLIENNFGTPAGPQINLHRAPTDADRMLQFRRPEYDYGVTRSHLISMESKKISDYIVEVKARSRVTASNSAEFIHEVTYTLFANNTLKVAHEIEVIHDAPEIPRVGIRFLSNKSLETIHWYGRGLYENYTDRCLSTDIGLYSSAVTFQFTNYVRPQENGTKSEVRWFALTDDHSRGVLFVTEDSPFHLNTLHYAAEEISGSIVNNGHSFSTRLPEPRKETVVCMDAYHAPLNDPHPRCLKVGEKISFSYSIRSVWCRVEELGRNASIRLPKVK